MMQGRLKPCVGAQGLASGRQAPDLARPSLITAEFTDGTAGDIMHRGARTIDQRQQLREPLRQGDVVAVGARHRLVAADRDPLIESVGQSSVAVQLEHGDFGSLTSTISGNESCTQQRGCVVEESLHVLGHNPVTHDDDLGRRPGLPDGVGQQRTPQILDTVAPVHGHEQ